MSYNASQYWEEVAQRIQTREKGNIIAGDDESYYEYKRNLSLDILKKINIENKTILEFGYGPGGNLVEFSKLNPMKIVGVDVSETMFELAKKLTSGIPTVELHLIKDELLPFGNNSFDYTFTITVLQHNTNETSLIKIIDEICRVTKDRIIISERIENKIKGSELCLGRPIEYYKKLFAKNGFNLMEVKFLKIQASYYVCGAIRKIFNSGSREEGEKLSNFSLVLEKMFLPVTSLIDKIIPSKRDLAYLIFEKTN